MKVADLLNLVCELVVILWRPGPLAIDMSRYSWKGSKARDTAPFAGLLVFFLHLTYRRLLRLQRGHDVVGIDRILAGFVQDCRGYLFNSRRRNFILIDASQEFLILFLQCIFFLTIRHH